MHLNQSSNNWNTHEDQGHSSSINVSVVKEISDRREIGNDVKTNQEDVEDEEFRQWTANRAYNVFF